MAFELFARLAYDGALHGSSRLPDELTITIRKQLSNPSPRFKCIGLLGGCAMLSRLCSRPSTGAESDESDLMGSQV